MHIVIQELYRFDININIRIASLRWNREREREQKYESKIFWYTLS